LNKNTIDFITVIDMLELNGKGEKIQSFYLLHHPNAIDFYEDQLSSMFV